MSVVLPPPRLGVSTILAFGVSITEGEVPGARVVDLSSDIAMDVMVWISPYDGFHPTEAGYQEIARVWVNRIQNAFELPNRIGELHQRTRTLVVTNPRRGG